MNQTTRQRIVGTIVLVTAAAILLPVILDGEGSYQQEPERRAPAAPPTPDIPVVTPQRPVVSADTEEPVADIDARQPEPDSATDEIPTETEVAGASEVAEAPAAPQLDSRGLPEAWSVQLGAFSNQNNVRALVTRLQEAGHPAYTRPITGSQGELTGVFVGPKVDRGTALALQAELAEQAQAFGLSGPGRVVRYQIEEQ